MVHAKIDGWTVFTDKQAVLDRFQQARASGERLSDVQAFKDAAGELASDAVVRGWINGEAIYDAFEREAARDQDLKQFRDFSKSFGTLEYLTLSAGAEEEGVRLEAAYKTDKEEKFGEFSPELDDVLPADALAYISFGNLEDYFNSLLDSADESFPEFQRERSKIEKALGFSLKSDLLPLFSKEGAIAVYRGGELEFPRLLFLLSVDEEEATRVIERLVALAELSGDATSRTVKVGDADATEVRFKSGLSVFALVQDGKAYVASAKSLLEQALSGSKLADDRCLPGRAPRRGRPGRDRRLRLPRPRGWAPAHHRFRRAERAWLGLARGSRQHEASRLGDPVREAGRRPDDALGLRDDQVAFPRHGRARIPLHIGVRYRGSPDKIADQISDSVSTPSSGTTSTAGSPARR